MIRAFDIILSGFALIIFSPVFILLFLLLRFTGEEEVLYRQSRIGYQGVKFDIFKFATMVKNSPNIGAGTLTMANDSRVLPVGAFLRKTKINELPQLFNIFLGNMSIVGPRPLVPDGERNYTSDQSRIIRSVRPGLTGIGSLILRDEESYYAHRADAHKFYREVISPYKASLEIWYIKKRSFRINLLIILSTFLAIFLPSIDTSNLFSALPDIPKKMIESRSQNKKF